MKAKHITKKLELSDRAEHLARNAVFITLKDHKEYFNREVTHCVKSVQIRGYFWSICSCIRIEYEDLRSKSPCSIRIQENADQK